MKKEDIEELLETMCQYNDVRITQTFSKEDEDIINVKCIPNSRKLELTYLKSGEVECYDSCNEAIEVIYNAIASPLSL